MERIRRFFWDHVASAESTSTVIMIAAAGILLAAGLIIWYGHIENFFGSAGSFIKSYLDSTLKG